MVKKFKINYFNIKKIGGSRFFPHDYWNIELPSNKSNEEVISNALTVIEETLENDENGREKTQNEKDKDNEFIEELKKSIDSIIKIIKNKEKNIEEINEEIATKKLINVFNYLEDKQTDFYWDFVQAYLPNIRLILISLHDMYITETKKESLGETKEESFDNFILYVIDLSNTGIESISQDNIILENIKSILVKNQKSHISFIENLPDDYSKLKSAEIFPDPKY